MRTLGRLAPSLTVLALAVTGCTTYAGTEDVASRSGVTPLPEVTQVADGDVADELGPAVSLPREDSLHPYAGDPGVDALRYDLDLTWDPGQRRLTGVATIDLRSMLDQESLRLDLGSALQVTGATLDGKRIDVRQHTDYLDLEASVGKATVHRLVLRYSGRPLPYIGPGEYAYEHGVQLLDGGGLSTCQEPFGAMSWYPVNDQPADKAYYSFTLRVPAPMVGVANGQLESRTTSGGTTVTRWVLDQPTSSYLTTLAFGEMTESRLVEVGGVPVTTWSPTDDDRTRRRLAYADDALRWVTDLLGDYPFASLGLLSNAGSGCGMETQTMITLGTNDYVTSPRVIVHEIAHQWWGDLVTPRDWRDVWMNEGMAYYVQKVFEAERSGRTVDEVMAEVRRGAKRSIRDAGPPGDYTKWGLTLYDVPALMWHDLRGRLGDEEFWRLVRAWPLVHAYGNATRDDLIDWWSEESGKDLEPVITAYLSGDLDPA